MRKLIYGSESCAVFLLIACDGKKQKSLSVNDDNKSLTFTLPEVPYYVAIPGRPG